MSFLSCSHISVVTSILTQLSISSLFILILVIVNLKILYYILEFQALFQFLNIEWMNEAYGNYSFNPL